VPWARWNRFVVRCAGKLPTSAKEMKELTVFLRMGQTHGREERYIQRFDYLLRCLFVTRTVPSPSNDEKFVQHILSNPIAVEHMHDRFYRWYPTSSAGVCDVLVGVLLRLAGVCVLQLQEFETLTGFLSCDEKWLSVGVFKPERVIHRLQKIIKALAQQCSQQTHTSYHQRIVVHLLKMLRHVCLSWSPNIKRTTCFRVGHTMDTTTTVCDVGQIVSQEGVYPRFLCIVWWSKGEDTNDTFFGFFRVVLHGYTMDGFVWITIRHVLPVYHSLLFETHYIYVRCLQFPAHVGKSCHGSDMATFTSGCSASLYW